MENQIVQLLFYCIPAVITGGIAYYFFNLHTKNEEGRRRYLLHKESQKDALPVRLQAYERMTLFLERISPAHIIINTNPNSSSKADYEAFLIQQIENEFNHNLAQQVYISEDCWGIIKAAKNATIQMLRKFSNNPEIESADKFREAVLTEFMDKQPPSATAISFIKKEITEIIG